MNKTQLLLKVIAALVLVLPTCGLLAQTTAPVTGHTANMMVTEDLDTVLTNRASSLNPAAEVAGSFRRTW